jgi:hypothetical protein
MIMEKQKKSVAGRIRNALAMHSIYAMQGVIEYRYNLHVHVAFSSYSSRNDCAVSISTSNVMLQSWMLIRIVELDLLESDRPFRPANALHTIALHRYTQTMHYHGVVLSLYGPSASRTSCMKSMGAVGDFGEWQPKSRLWVTSGQ